MRLPRRVGGVCVLVVVGLVTVPYYCPDTPAVTPNPVYLYLRDRFEKPYPFEADIVVSTDEEIRKLFPFFPEK